MSGAIPNDLPDTLFLWWMGEPDHPRLVGELAMARALRGPCAMTPSGGRAALASEREWAMKGGRP